MCGQWEVTVHAMDYGLIIMQEADFECGPVVVPDAGG